MNYYKPRYFQPYEIFPDTMLKNFPVADPWTLIDPRMLYTLDQLRERYGKCTVNNYYWGGKLKYRGMRPIAPNMPGARYSQHKYGRAADCTFQGKAIEEVTSDLINHLFTPAFQYITCIELGFDWLHFDCRNHDRNGKGVLAIVKGRPAPSFVTRSGFI